MLRERDTDETDEIADGKPIQKPECGSRHRVDVGTPFSVVTDDGDTDDSFADRLPAGPFENDVIQVGDREADQSVEADALPARTPQSRRAADN